jgi:pyrroline-5-carboxylate reductase
MLTQRIAFIGAGNMASALIEGLIGAGTCRADQITASDVRSEALAALAERHGIRTTSDNREAARGAEILVLATKPQVFGTLLPELSPASESVKLVISIAAGVPLSVIEQALGTGRRVLRAMPNTPALVRAGATAIAAGTHASAADLDIAEAIFQSVGIVERVSESLLDAVTGLSGSGPAYVFAMVEALTAAGVRVGLAEETAAALSAQTVYGAAKLLRESGTSPAQLRANVTSPGGTTSAGLARLAERDFAGVVADAVQRATERARELGEDAKAKLGKG